MDSILENFSRVRQQNKRINEEITSLLCQTFVTPLEREDLEALARALYRIRKTIEKILRPDDLSKAYLARRFLRPTSPNSGNRRPTWSSRWCGNFGTHPIGKIKEENDRLHTMEGDADKLVFEMLRELYSGKVRTDASHHPPRSLSNFWRRSSTAAGTRAT